jgi:hypothetical protein
MLSKLLPPLLLLACPLSMLAMMATPAMLRRRGRRASNGAETGPVASHASRSLVPTRDPQQHEE